MYVFSCECMVCILIYIVLKRVSICAQTIVTDIGQIVTNKFLIISPLSLSFEICKLIDKGFLVYGIFSSEFLFIVILQMYKNSKTSPGALFL